MKEPQNQTPQKLLRAGINALKAGARQDAENLIFQAIVSEPTNARAWLWMSVVQTDLEEKIRCLEQAASLKPEDARIANRLDELRDQQTQRWVEEGYEALEDDDLDTARQRFLSAVDAEEENVEAWWGLYRASESAEDQIICLENVLTLDPAHPEAERHLEALQPDRALFESRRGRKSPDGVLEPLDLEDELSCPYCGKPTEFEERECPACGRPLWIEKRKPSPRPSYWILIGLELGLLLLGAAMPLLLFVVLDTTFATFDLSTLLALYLNGSTGLTPTLRNQATALVPHALFWLALTPSVLSLFSLACAVSRWPPAYRAGAFLSLLRILAGISGLGAVLITGFIDAATEVLMEATPPNGLERAFDFAPWAIPGLSVLIAALSAVSFRRMLALRAHFEVKPRRILLTIDRQVARHEMSLWMRARAYAKRGMWALAAHHAQHALAFEETAERHLLLATAYYHLERPDQARLALADARAHQPDHPQIACIQERLEASPKA